MLSWRIKLALLTAVLTFATYQFLKPTIKLSYGLFLLPLRWPEASTPSLITEHRDKFDVTFERYPATQDKPGNRKTLHVPPILHHIHLGGELLKAEWNESRQACLDVHPNWQTYLWEDDNAGEFVEVNFPEMKSTWDSYRYPAQRADALRYMLLWRYGGAVLDLDLSCKRSLEPLRRFEFVAPAAQPTGFFSMGMMLSTPNNTFVGELIRNLPTYNHRWLLNPYATVMFSTGCHYASTIFTQQQNRTNIRILSGSDQTPSLNVLTGHVETPLFKHLGSSSWHNFNASFITTVGNPSRWSVFAIVPMVLIIVSLIAAPYAWRRISRRRKLNLTETKPPSFPETPSKEV